MACRINKQPFNFLNFINVKLNKKKKGWFQANWHERNQIFTSNLFFLAYNQFINFEHKYIYIYVYDKKKTQFPFTRLNKQLVRKYIIYN